MKLYYILFRRLVEGGGQLSMVGNWWSPMAGGWRSLVGGGDGGLWATSMGDSWWAVVAVGSGQWMVGGSCRCTVSER